MITIGSSTVTSPYRLKSVDITNITGKTVLSKYKFKLFEAAIEYIKTSNHSTKTLLNEILGFSSSNCKAFKELSIDNSFFFPDSITQETTYFIIICYLRDFYQNKHMQDVLPILTSKSLNIWTNNQLEISSLKLKDNYIGNIKVKSGMVSFMDSQYKVFPSVQLSKLVTTKYDDLDMSACKYTSKIEKLKLNKIFHNQIYISRGKCLGAVKYFLEQMVIAYSLDKHKRKVAKDTYVKGLEIDDLKFKDSRIDHIISAYQNHRYSPEYLQDNFDIYTTIKAFPQNLAGIVSFIKLNMISQLYIQVLSSSHALGLIIIVKGNALKFLLYDPNNKLLYSHVQCNIDSLNESTYQYICNQFSCLLKYNENKHLLIKGYTSKYENSKIIEPLNNKLSSINLESDALLLQELLILGIMNNDYILINKLIQSNTIDIDLILENKYTPLTLATRYSNEYIIELLVKNSKSPNMLDSFQKSAYDVAINRGKSDIRKILLKNGVIQNTKILSNPILSNRIFVL